MLVFKYCKINQDEVQNMTVMKHLPAWPVFWPPQQRELSQPPLASVEAGASIEVPGPSIEVPGPPVEGITVTMQPGKASLSLCYSSESTDSCPPVLLCREHTTTWTSTHQPDTQPSLEIYGVKGSRISFHYIILFVYRSSGRSAPFLLAPAEGWGALRAPNGLGAVLGAFGPLFIKTNYIFNQNSHFPFAPFLLAPAEG